MASPRPGTGPVNPYQAPRATVADAASGEDYQDVRLFAANGRIGRARYIAWSIGGTMLLYIGIVLVSALFGALLPVLAGVIAVVGMIAVLVWQIMLTVQRAHDFDMSGWLALIILIPLAVFVFWFVRGTDGENRWGPKTKPNSTGVVVAAWACALIIPVVGILAAIAIPQYQQYVERAKAAQMQQPR